MEIKPSNFAQKCPLVIENGFKVVAINVEPSGTIITIENSREKPVNPSPSSGGAKFVKDVCFGCPFAVHASDGMRDTGLAYEGECMSISVDSLESAKIKAKLEVES